MFDSATPLKEARFLQSFFIRKMRGKMFKLYIDVVQDEKNFSLSDIPILGPMVTPLSTKDKPK